MYDFNTKQLIEIENLMVTKAKNKELYYIKIKYLVNIKGILNNKSDNSQQEAETYLHFPKVLEGKSIKQILELPEDNKFQKITKKAFIDIKNANFLQNNNITKGLLACNKFRTRTNKNTSEITSYLSISLYPKQLKTSLPF